MSLQAYLRERRERIDAELERLLPPDGDPPGKIHAAVRHSVFAGGKRIRPILALAAAEACGRPGGVETAACALECIHTYSLIHDDLPALDNDDLRRGKPTCHKAYGEAVAILAGDTLLTFAFELLAGLESPESTRVALCAELARAAGARDGMIAGQIADLAAEGQRPEAAALDFIHRAKTASLIRASARFGALCADAPADRYEGLSAYGGQIGLAFQIVDDILDVVSSSEELGKTAGKDVGQRKATFPALYGIEESRRRAEACRRSAHAALEGFGSEAWALRGIADLIVDRTN